MFAYVPLDWETTREELNELGSLLYVRAEAVAGRLRASVGRQSGKFDLMRTGESVVLTDVWAFNVLDLDNLEQQLQAANYFMTRVREDGVVVAAGRSQRIELGADVPVEVVYDPLREDRRGSVRRVEVFEAAREAWERLDMAVRPLDRYLTETALLAR